MFLVKSFFLSSICNVLYYKVILTETNLKLMGGLFHSLSFKFIKAVSVKIMLIHPEWKLFYSINFSFESFCLLLLFQKRFHNFYVKIIFWLYKRFVKNPAKAQFSHFQQKLLPNHELHEIFILAYADFSCLHSRSKEYIFSMKKICIKNSSVSLKIT